MRRILRPVDVLKINRQLRDQLTALQQSLAEARRYAVDYELSETRQDQLDNATEAKQLLEKTRSGILAASEYDIFSAPDVAHLTGVADYIIAKLK